MLKQWLVERAEDVRWQEIPQGVINTIAFVSIECRACAQQIQVLLF
jgi:hypothetical protein